MQVIVVYKVDHTLHELGAMAMVCGAIIQIKHQRRDVTKALTDRFPPLRDAIGEAIAGHFGEDTIEKDFIHGGYQKPHRSHQRGWLEIVIGSGSLDSTFAPTGEGTDFHGSFGIERHP